MITQTETGIELRDTIRDLVRTYEDTAAKIRTAHQAFADVPDSPFGGHYGWYKSKYSFDLDNAIKETGQAAWRYILQHAGILPLCSCKQREEIDKQIEKGELPAITEENIGGMLDTLSAKLPGLLDASICEAFEFLRVRGDYKTNSEYEIPEKVIKSWWFESNKWNGWPRFNYSTEAQVDAIDNAFHMMDGKGPIKHGTPDTLSVAFRCSEQAKCAVGETPYFKFKVFGNGNVHLWIKRDDLRQELNKIGGANLLKHDNAATRQEA